MSRRVTDFLAEYTTLLTPKTEAPERFHFWCGVSTIAGALRRRVWIDQGAFNWYPNFYVFLIGPPGVVKKSTTISIGTKLLREIPGIQFGADCVTWQSFTTQVSNAEDIFASGPVDLQELGEAQHTNTRAITIHISELGTFLDPSNEGMVNVLTELWDCKTDIPWLKATKTQGEDQIINPFVNIIAGTTPKWLSDTFRYRIGGWGLSSRCVFLFCNKPERSIAFPARLWRGQFKLVMQPLQETLLHISSLYGPREHDEQALAFGEVWYAEHQDRMTAVAENEHSDPWLQYFLARKWDHLNKLALVISCSRSDEPTITLRDMVDAANRMKEVEDELHKIFVFDKDASRREMELYWSKWPEIRLEIDRTGSIEQRLLWSFLVRSMPFPKAQGFISGMLAADWLRQEQEGNSVYFILGEKAPAATREQAEKTKLSLVTSRP